MLHLRLLFLSSCFFCSSSTSSIFSFSFLVSLAKALLLLPLEQALLLQVQPLLTQALLLLQVPVMLTGLLELDRITDRMDYILCMRHILDDSRK